MFGLFSIDKTRVDLVHNSLKHLLAEKEKVEGVINSDDYYESKVVELLGVDYNMDKFLSSVKRTTDEDFIVFDYHARAVTLLDSRLKAPANTEEVLSILTRYKKVPTGVTYTFNLCVCAEELVLLKKAYRSGKRSCSVDLKIVEDLKNLSQESLNYIYHVLASDDLRYLYDKIRIVDFLTNDTSELYCSVHVDMCEKSISNCSFETSDSFTACMSYAVNKFLRCEISLSQLMRLGDKIQSKLQHQLFGAIDNNLKVISGC